MEPPAIVAPMFFCSTPPAVFGHGCRGTGQMSVRTSETRDEDGRHLLIGPCFQKWVLLPVFTPIAVEYIVIIIYQVGFDLTSWLDTSRRAAHRNSEYAGSNQRFEERMATSDEAKINAWTGTAPVKRTSAAESEVMAMLKQAKAEVCCCDLTAIVTLLRPTCREASRSEPWLLAFSCRRWLSELRLSARQKPSWTRLN